MNLKKITAILLSLSTLAICTSTILSENGKAGKTGSPGETTCTDCHADYAANSGGGTITIGGITGGTYTPGTTYNLTMTVTRTGSTVFGMDFEALTAANANAGTLAISNATQTQLKSATVSAVSRQGVVHQLNGGFTSNTHTFNFLWTAPAAGTGNVNLYYAAIAGDHDGSEAGDYVYNGSLPLTEAAGCVTPTQPLAITGSASVCSGSSQVYSVAAVSGATDYIWTLPSGWTGTSITNTISVVAGAVGGNISVAAHNTCGSSPLRTLAITENVSVTPSVSIASSATTICVGTNVTFTATPTNGGTTPTYQWKLNGANVGTNSATYSNSALANGNIVSCVMTSNAACLSTTTATSNSVTMTITTGLTPAVSIASSATTICAGTNVTFTATPTNGGTTPTYQWKLNGANVGTNSATYSNSALANGNIVSCVMTSNAACLTTTTATSNSVTMTITTGLTPTVSIASSATTICAGTNVTFTATQTNGGTTPTYQWKLNGANVGTNSVTYSNSALANGNIVSCVMTSNAACLTATTATSNSVTMTITTGLTPAVSIASSATTICAGTNVTFTATPTNGGASPTYQWKLNGANVGTNSATYSNNALVNNDQVQCVMTSNSNCVTTNTASSAMITMVVNNSFVPTIASNGSTTFCQGNNVVLTASAGTNYLWSPGGQTTQSITVVNGGTYSVTVTSGLCSGTSTGITVNVNPLPVVTLSTIAPICSTDPSIILTGGSPVGGTYSGTGVSSGSFNPSTAGVGTAVITYSYTNGNSCSNSATTSVLVKNCTVSGCTSAPAMPNYIYGSTYIPCGLPLAIYYVKKDTAATSYTWTVPANAVIVANSGNYISVKYSSNFVSGNVCVTANNACGSSPAKCISVHLGTMYVSKIQGPSRVCPTNIISQYSVPVVTGATSYTWTATGGATLTQSGNTATINFSTVTVSMVLVHVHVENACGQFNDQYTWVQVSNKCKGDHGDGDGHDHDGNNHHENGRLAANENSFELYPNPSAGLFTIQLGSEIETSVTITLMDMVGKTQLVLVKDINVGNNSIDVNAMNLAHGTYMLKFEIVGQPATISRIVINN